MSDKPVICWLRRDLRLHDNLAMNAAIESGQPVIVVFVFDPGVLKSERMSAPRMKFMLAALESLDAELKERNARLLVRQGKPLDVLRSIVDETGANSLYFNTDYTPFARKRDAEICEGLSIPVQNFHDRVMMPPQSIEKKSGGPYAIYSPYKRAWREKPKVYPDPIRYQVRSDHFYALSGLDNPGLPSLADLGFETAIEIPAAKRPAALDRLRRFLDSPVYAYKAARNRLADPYGDTENGTSALSPYIRFGLLSLREIRAAAGDAYREAEGQTQQESVVAWMDEIIWHEFYTQILYHFPHVVKDNFNAKYDAVQWRDAPDELAAWKAGQTGYPVVDAAMRQLMGTGWMHNRARMIVASFLTKDLLIDWREGELHFMQWLLDGDLAANNGGWQWAAGTGTDAQPYFRIFNPVSQSKKFDPDGRFIRRWVPELRDVPDAHIHTPWEMARPPNSYPAPMVDHGEARKRTLAAFEVVKSG